MSSQRWGWALGWLVAGLLAAAASSAAAEALPPAAAQTPPLQVVILRPSEGEIYYTAPSGPRTLALISGKVSGGDFDLQQLGVELDILQDGKSIGRVSGSADASGSFSFRVFINANGDAHLGTPESNCFSCHENARVELPAGVSTVRVTAVEPTGAKVVAERRVVLDQSANAPVTVRVNVQGERPSPPGWPSAVRGLSVTAATRIYEWRARKFQGRTDAQGRATMEIEALTQAPTRYLFDVVPAVVDGVYYQAGAPVELVLPPGATSAGTISLTVRAQLGQISGRVTLAGKPPAGPVSVRAVALTSGRAFVGPVTAGEYSLAGLPIGAYLVAVDPEQAAALGSRSVAARLDLADRINASAALELKPLIGRTVRGSVRDAAGGPPLPPQRMPAGRGAIPFAWVTGGSEGVVATALPTSGSFILYDLPARVWALQVSAPGYWSRQIPARNGLQVALTPRPDTRILPWGSGSIVLPDKTNATLSGDRIQLRRGWVWGTAGRALDIDMPDASITLQSASFAVEYLPGERSWLYVTDGEARVGSPGEPGVLVRGGEMVAFAARDVTTPRPVPIDAAALQTLHADRSPLVEYETQPGWQARVKDLLAAVGVYVK